MTWATLPDPIRAIAEEVLTRKQLAAYKLSSNGLSEARIAIELKITRRSVRDRLLTADIKIRRHPDYPESEAA